VKIPSLQSILPNPKKDGGREYSKVLFARKLVMPVSLGLEADVNSRPAKQALGVARSKLRNVACMGATSPHTITFSKKAQDLKEWTHVKTQLLEMTAVEPRNVDGEMCEMDVQLKDLATALSNVQLSVAGRPPLQLELAQGPRGQVWQCIWEKGPNVSFPLEAALSFDYVSPMDSQKWCVTNGKCKVFDPELPPSACCAVL